MILTKVKYRDWEFEVDRELTRKTYESVLVSGSESCVCYDCKNYVSCRDNVYSDEIKQLFETLPDGLHHIGGWFHFKGRVLAGNDHRIPLPSGGHTFDLTEINDKFSIGFAEGNASTHFADKSGLVQVEFRSYIPGVINKSLYEK